MRLKKIKLSGFKSFVDPTTIPVNGNVIGIVGPNGCGKSNIIDAVRWVMGESSAKHLRGDSMADVIFSGSTARKPVGKASVELIFDNGDGGAGGQYASYAEISVRREASRDGQSDYYLNKTKCRKKDVTDIFLGTGLGPRAYSIIEQGMVTRIIEARPEDLRSFFEEAAGISRYKERRRETENRIKHARENLSRVEDIRKELDTQLNRLQRQSKAAQKYKELKAQERLLRAQLLSLRWRLITEHIGAHDSTLSQQETNLEAAIADQRAIEAELEKIRSGQIEAADHFNAVQAEFYSIGAEVANIEQAIQHARESHQQHMREHEQINRSWEEANLHLESDVKKLEQLGGELELSTPRRNEAVARRTQAVEALSEAEAQMQAWQAAWEQFSQQAAEPVKAREVQQARMRQLEPHMAQLREREQRLRAEAQYISSELAKAGVDTLRQQAAERDLQCESQEQRLEQIEVQMLEVRAQEEVVGAQLKDLRGRQQSGEARLASLRELQAAALGQHDAGLNEWLKTRQLNDAPRLAGMLSVEPGWEQAAERVLGAELGAVCVSDLDGMAASLTDLKKSELVLFDLSAPRGASAPARRTTLLEKVSSQADLSGLLAGVYIAENLGEALSMRAELVPHESVVTRDGIWLGRNWVAVANEESVRAGIIGRNREIESVSAELAEIAQATARAQADLSETQAQQQRLDAERAEARRQLNELQRERTTLHGLLGREESKLGQLSARHQQIETELGELGELLRRDDEQLQAARSLLQEAEAQGAQHEQTRRQLQEQRDRLRGALEAARAAANAANEALHQLDMERQAQQTAFDSTQQSIARLEGQLKHLAARRTELEQILATHEDPEADLQQRLEELLQKRVAAEERLTEARAALTSLDTALREQEQARSQQERQVQQVRQALEQERMARQELIVRRQTLDEQIREAGFEAAAVLNDVAAEMTEEACQTELDQAIARIERLGPINLVAIQEYEEQSQRKGFLDQQYDDLSQALATLEDAMRKMDRETRTRFKETFDKVNTGFQAFFPRLFGGGHAYLELVGDDLLDTGVSVMARPPGKRNSTIHLLSGGEKALTAVSLLFAIFELNPAPFCLLDEVDAPLDDANVERYAQTLKTMSSRTQLMYITHNKISMEIADVLLGVTMSEPGVSRLVAVDVDQAMEMVAQ